VGLNVGTSVGCKVGLNVGASVGLEVLSSDGALDVVGEFDTLGIVDGCDERVGDPLTEGLELRDGRNEGSLEIVGLVDILGSEVTVGESVGLKVGASVGLKVG